jgi:hypothetical protein
MAAAWFDVEQPLLSMAASHEGRGQRWTASLDHQLDIDTEEQSGK